MQYNLRLFWFSSNFPKRLQTSYILKRTRKFSDIKRSYLSNLLIKLTLSVIMIIFCKHWFRIFGDCWYISWLVEITSCCVFHFGHFPLHIFDFSLKLCLFRWLSGFLVEGNSGCHVILIEIKREKRLYLWEIVSSCFESSYFVK